MGIWSSLVRLAGTGGGASPLSALPATPTSTQLSFTQSLQPTKPIQPVGKPENGESLDTSYLDSCTIQTCSQDFHQGYCPSLARNYRNVMPTCTHSHTHTHIHTHSHTISLSLTHTVDEIDIPLLRQQQIRLGLLKAARVLFSQQENLRQIMAHPTSSGVDQYSLFQQLLSAATRPSPIKAMFGRDELEVGGGTAFV